MKILDKNTLFHIATRLNAEMWNQLARTKLTGVLMPEGILIPIINTKQLWLCLLTADVSIKNIGYSVGTKTVKVLPNLFLQKFNLIYKHNIVKKFRRREYYVGLTKIRYLLLGVIKFLCSNQGNYGNCLEETIITN